MRALVRIFRIFMLMALAFVAVACAGQDTATKRQTLINTLDASYAAISAAVVVYGLQPACRDGGPLPPLCSNPNVVMELDKAKLVADVAIEKVRRELQTSTDASTLQRVFQAGMDALAIYAKVLQTYGVKQSS